MRSAVILGRKPESARALETALSAGLSVAAVVEDTDRANPGQRPLTEAAARLGIPSISIEELATPVDYVISYLYRRRVPQRVLRLARELPVNFHPAPLPEFRGVGGYNVAILEGRSEWGVSAHVMEDQIDAGDILGERRFPIASDATVFMLERQTRGELLRLFADLVPQLASGRHVERRPQGEGRYISAAEFERLRRIEVTDSPEVISRKIRAFWYPPYGGAAIYIGGREYTVVDEAVLRQIARDSVE